MEEMEGGRGLRTDSAQACPKLGRGSGFEGKVARLGRCLPLRPPGCCCRCRRRRPGRTAGSPSAPCGIQGPQRSWCAPGPRRRWPPTRAPEGFVAGRTQEAGTGGRWGGSRSRGVSRGSRTLPQPRVQERPLPRWALLASGFWSGEGPRKPGTGRGARVLAARGASEVLSGKGCGQTPLCSASPPRNCPLSQGSDTSSASRPMRSPAEGGDTKASRRSQSDACFLGRRGDTLLGSRLLSQSTPGSAWELWEL